jgi:TolB-like protein
MKKRILYQTIGLIIATTMMFPNPAFAQKATVGIPDFENKTGQVSNIGPGMSTIMTTALSKSGKFQIIERSKLGALADEQLLGDSGLVDRSTAARKGRVIGVDYLLLGTITRAEVAKSGIRLGGFKMGKVALHLEMDISFMDTETGEVKFATFVHKSDTKNDWGVGDIQVDVSNPAFESVAREVSEGLAKDIAFKIFPPKVMRVAGETVTFSYGTGFFEVGDTLRVVDTGGGFTDPDTGEKIVEMTEIGVLKVSRVESNYTTGILTSGSAVEGAICELIEVPTSSKKKKKKKK